MHMREQAHRDRAVAHSREKGLSAPTRQRILLPLQLRTVDQTARLLIIVIAHLAEQLLELLISFILVRVHEVDERASESGSGW